MKRVMYEQGDVLLVRLDEVDLGGAEVEPRDNGRLVLAYGEVTGHSHALADADATVYRLPNGDRILSIAESIVRDKAALVHEEHATLYLDPGHYRVVEQMEYHEGAIRRIVD